ncbi:MAG: cytochrome b5-like heme/steroid binding domain-containing protein [Candidatus Paceibacterota bacterium]|jgi:cytochrome b involved in lipid metabolism
MRQKVIILGVIALAIIFVITFSFNRAPKTETANLAATPKVQNSPTNEFSSSDVALHADSTSCWTIVRGNVYDLTGWIVKHPGGEQAILGLCGKDGTTAFENQHGGMEKQEQILATFKIGILKD